ncbi:monocarboxylate transporter 5-like [Parasteatoda tepidariorum]|uniref:monocarboxylate transporter 5-like n=1 Tax=Parasteatoda tepidariorum TaxID=114398 RepID=UPI001C720D9C|nr:monocarboxylate transporter 12-like isoform X2 [Parasteatoda tepidariorum]
MKSETIASIEIITACFMINFLYGASARMVSLFFVESIHRFEVNRNQASLPYILPFIMRHLCGPLQGYLQQLFQTKSLIIFGNVGSVISIGACFFAEDILTVTILWGFIFGVSFGLGIQYLPLLLNAHFTTNQSKANGFAYSGACFGGVVMPPIMEACIEYYGLNGSFLILSAILAHFIPFSMLLKSSEEKSHKNEHSQNINKKVSCIEMKESKKTHLPSTSLDDNICQNLHKKSFLSSDTEAVKLDINKEIDTKSKRLVERENSKNKPLSAFTLENFKIFIDPLFIIILVMTACTFYITTVMMAIILDFVRDKNVGANLEIYYVMILALADICGRIGSGFVIDKQILPSPTITSICCVCTGLSSLGLLFINNYLLLMFIDFLLTVFTGSLLVLQIALVHEFMQPEKRNMAMVCKSMLFAPLCFTVSPMIGYFRGEHGSYDGVMYTLTGISFFSGFIIYFIPHLAKRRKTTTSDNVT